MYNKTIAKDTLYLSTDINIDTLKNNYEIVRVNSYPRRFKEIKGMQISYLTITTYNDNIYEFLNNNIVFKVTYENVDSAFTIINPLKCQELEIINSNVDYSYNLFNVREIVLRNIKNKLFSNDLIFNGSYLEVSNCVVKKIPKIISKDTMNTLIFKNCLISNFDNINYINSKSLTLSNNNITRLPNIFKDKEYYFLDLDNNNLDSVENLNVILGLDLNNNNIKYLKNVRTKVLLLNNNQINDPEDLINVVADRIELRGNPITKDAIKMKKLRKKMRRTVIET
jgi:hypothetical protein